MISISACPEGKEGLAHCPSLKEIIGSAGESVGFWVSNKATILPEIKTDRIAMAILVLWHQSKAPMIDLSPSYMLSNRFVRRGCLQPCRR